MANTKTKRKARGRKVSREEFCLIWESAASVAEVASRTGMSPENAMALASYYRKHPTNPANLKKFRQGRPSHARMDAATLDRKLQAGGDREGHIAWLRLQLEATRLAIRLIEGGE